MARERNLESAQAELGRRYHISDDDHPQQQADAAAAITDQVIVVVFFDFIGQICTPFERLMRRTFPLPLMLIAILMHA